jgi:hypothetical protein
VTDQPQPNLVGATSVDLAESDVERYGIGTMTPGPESATIDIVEEFDGDVYERYSQALQNAMLPTGRFTRELVERNLQGYLDNEKFAATLLGLGRHLGSPNREQLSNALMSQIMNWLMSFRLYLDHAETELKRRFGKDSAHVHRFTDQTHECYDGSIGYRFIYRFRNYVQHCGAPLSFLSLSPPRPEASNPLLRQSARFTLSRDDLLAKFDWGTAVRRDLVAMPETFELQPLAEEAMEQLRIIDRLILELNLNEGARTIHDAREALTRLPAGSPGVPVLLRFRPTIEGTIRKVSLSPTPISVEAVEQFERLSSGALAVEEMYYVAAPPPAPAFDPDTVRERFRRDNRAVQVMSLWQAEGGGTPAFQQTVNEIVLVDQGVEPLVTGLINMSATLLHMTAAALGIDAGGLLGGLLDVYSATNEGTES